MYIFNCWDDGICQVFKKEVFFVVEIMKCRIQGRCRLWCVFIEFVIWFDVGEN